MPASPHNQTPLFSQMANEPEMGELIDLFVSELPKRVDSVVEAWRSQDAQSLRRLAHQLKGSCAGYGFPTIGTAAGRLESAIDVSADLARLDTEVAELVDLCRRARAGSTRAAA